MRISSLAALVLTLSTGTVWLQTAAAQTPSKPATPTQAQPASPTPVKPSVPAPVPPAAPSSAARRAPAKPVPTRLIVRGERGTPLGDVHVSVAGPGDRTVDTGADGRADLPAMPDGPYRLRFDRDGYFTLERDIVIKNSAPVEIAVALDLAPPPPPPPPPPAPVHVPEPQKPAANVPPGPPVFLSVPTFLERNLIGREPVKDSIVSCTAGALTRVVQIRDSQAEHTHADADEILYVVAGEGAVRVKGASTALTAGSLAVLPRGTAHALDHSGRNPLVVISVLSDQPCPKAGGGQ